MQSCPVLKPDCFFFTAVISSILSYIPDIWMKLGPNQNLLLLPRGVALPAGGCVSNFGEEWAEVDNGYVSKGKDSRHRP